MNWTEKIQILLNDHVDARVDICRSDMIKEAIARKESLVSANGALATWTPAESTGRSPKDTLIVRRKESESDIDWDSPNNISLDECTFDMLMEDALATLSGKKTIFITNRVLGADPTWALPVKVVTDKALTALFTDNMFRPIPKDVHKSCFENEPFTLLVCPYDKLDQEKYKGRLRKLDNGNTSTMAVAMDMDRRLGVIYGSAYGGSVKKMVFTVMNYYLPAKNILPIHCSCNAGSDGDTALLLGLSGTGKTTLSADARRALLGDDEHGWAEHGVANLENGCYAKLIDLDPEKEPEIFQAVFHNAKHLDHGAIVENAMMWPNGTFDLFDDRLTPNSRASYPLTFLSNIKNPPVGGHPKTILFLTADANGVIPPVSKLTKQQAMLWFLMGYTSKLAGTETGIVEPRTVFSRFFGEPFMPRTPNVYARMLGEKLDKHGSRVFLINTGWSGGPYGVGKRMDINLTRQMVHAALSGGLDRVEYREDAIFHIMVPTFCPGIPSEILDPQTTWPEPKHYIQRAKKLAAEFASHFTKAYGDKGIDSEIVAQCPGM